MEGDGNNSVPIETKKNVHPSYKRMVTLAIQSKDEKGASLKTIYGFLEERWSIGKTGRRFVRSALKKGVEKKIFTQRKATYRIAKCKIKEKPKPKKVRSSALNPKPAKPVIAKRASKPKPKPKPKSTNATVTTSTPQTSLVWTWQFHDNGWCNYHPDASKVVEATYQEYLRNPGITDVRSVQSGEWHYLVDFRQMTQQNIQHENHTVRRIRRVNIPLSDTEFRKRFQ
uniref:Bifunctional linker histone H1/H5 n=1 Tax=Clandestinovirus TaxID=2831644 RepID=A0A8F8PQR7_9VIRU|nr:bifunctional linker histone H1/H5 [Clandestinovirus]